ncbi:hypothetical protein cyc_03548 [Cyclospora cayetanensis]|uniref:Uncharacterized protein n=1 Tax=Cyclospora cayetanensis TaxID=88456 RepID=A0A1D3CW24_9EIME|nr:hypothetical protein cyc_03548 [Cyclospora cayetanensis]
MASSPGEGFAPTSVADRTAGTPTPSRVHQTPWENPQQGSFCGGRLLSRTPLARSLPPQEAALRLTRSAASLSHKRPRDSSFSLSAARAFFRSIADAGTPRPPSSYAAATPPPVAAHPATSLREAAENLAEARPGMQREILCDTQPLEFLPSSPSDYRSPFSPLSCSSPYSAPSSSQAAAVETGDTAPVKTQAQSTPAFGGFVSEEENASPHRRPPSANLLLLHPTPSSVERLASLTAAAAHREVSPLAPELLVSRDTPEETASSAAHALAAAAEENLLRASPAQEVSRRGFRARAACASDAAAGRSASSFASSSNRQLLGRLPQAAERTARGESAAVRRTPFPMLHSRQNMQKKLQQHQADRAPAVCSDGNSSRSEKRLCESPLAATPKKEPLSLPSSNARFRTTILANNNSWCKSGYCSSSVFARTRLNDSPPRGVQPPRASGAAAAAMPGAASGQAAAVTRARLPDAAAPAEENTAAEALRGEVLKDHSLAEAQPQSKAAARAAASEAEAEAATDSSAGAAAARDAKKSLQHHQQGSQERACRLFLQLQEALLLRRETGGCSRDLLGGLKQEGPKASEAERSSPSESPWGCSEKAPFKAMPCLESEAAAAIAESRPPQPRGSGEPEGALPLPPSKPREFPLETPEGGAVADTSHDLPATSFPESAAQHIPPEKAAGGAVFAPLATKTGGPFETALLRDAGKQILDTPQQENPCSYSSLDQIGSKENLSGSSLPPCLPEELTTARSGPLEDALGTKKTPLPGNPTIHSLLCNPGCCCCCCASLPPAASAANRGAAAGLRVLRGGDIEEALSLLRKAANHPCLSLAAACCRKGDEASALNLMRGVFLLELQVPWEVLFVQESQQGEKGDPLSPPSLLLLVCCALLFTRVVVSPVNCNEDCTMRSSDSSRRAAAKLFEEFCMQPLLQLLLPQEGLQQLESALAGGSFQQSSIQTLKRVLRFPPPPFNLQSCPFCCPLQHPKQQDSRHQVPMEASPNVQRQGGALRQFTLASLLLHAASLYILEATNGDLEQQHLQRMQLLLCGIWAYTSQVPRKGNSARHPQIRKAAEAAVALLKGAASQVPP